ncbi:MAG: PQQ-dependent sugar dehydrogenase, partial [Thermoanaerobaculia bacterium]
MRLDELRLGARYYSNTPAPPSTQNFFAGDLAEVILYGRALKDEERSAVEGYLLRKYRAFLELPGLPEKPPVQLLAGGFRARELPVKLSNVNDLLYEPSGRLLALGYDGRIHALTDTDGDGLEDRVEPYWSERSFLSPLAMALRPEGLYVSAHKQISLLLDTDRDGRADREEVVAEGWPQPDVPTGSGVDVLGMAFDGEGSLFFALGCSDFTNAYRVKDGKARYRLEDERGTILKLSPDRKRREIVCTGTRFPCTLAFNRHGDLFATDQEGETWLPGGNPLDELLHILPGRHYGFPPRHPAHLPGVVDEPAVVEFGPQHQSTCGLVWNEPGPGQGLFGPPSWEGDGFVAGYSRGKVWRVRCVRTQAGYVARASLFAALSLLTLDVAITPAGDLLVACHSGSPDWGSGPNGGGRLFKISPTDRQAPRPVLAW